jgi:UDP-2,3-diacylglucosamine pyrophosphatase LpxH
LELELVCGGRLLFLSDVHLSGGGPTSDFAAGAELAELLGTLKGRPGQLVVVLGGDILDLLRGQHPQAPRSWGEALDRVLAGPDAIALGRALRALAERPDTTVIYLVGNHDAALAWDAAARRRVAHTLGVHHVALRLRVGAGTDESGPPWLVCEHGDALDPYNRHADPFDPLDSPLGEHVVTEVINRLEAAAEHHPSLALGDVDAVRPASMLPTWLAANFFYRFMNRALRRFALPLLAIFVLLHLPLAAVILGDLSSRFARLGELGVRAVGWAVAIVAVDLLLLAALSAFLGRSLRRALHAYGASPPDGAGPDSPARQAALAAHLTQCAPGARALLVGHSHQAALTRTQDGWVLVDAGCWVRALVAVPARFGLPPVFVPAYRCTWVEVQAEPAGVTVSLWERELAVRRRLTFVERLVAAGRLPGTKANPPRLVATATVTGETAQIASIS